MGFDVGKEFTNNWWGQLFNKAASNIVVEQSEVRITPFPLFIHLLLDEYYDGAE